MAWWFPETIYQITVHRNHEYNIFYIHGLQEPYSKTMVCVYHGLWLDGFLKPYSRLWSPETLNIIFFIFMVSRNHIAKPWSVHTMACGLMVSWNYTSDYGPQKPYSRPWSPETMNIIFSIFMVSRNHIAKLWSVHTMAWWFPETIL
jgi:hypothetical protein